MQTAIFRRAPVAAGCRSTGAVLVVPGVQKSVNLKMTDGSIRPGLVTRLHQYALDRVTEAGFYLVTASAVEIYTLDADKPASERAYTVRFQNAQGGYLELSGIHTKHGWPSMDFGLMVGERA